MTNQELLVHNKYIWPHCRKLGWRSWCAREGAYRSIPSLFGCCFFWHLLETKRVQKYFEESPRILLLMRGFRYFTVRKGPSTLGHFLNEVLRPQFLSDIRTWNLRCATTWVILFSMPKYLQKCTLKNWKKSNWLQIGLNLKLENVGFQMIPITGQGNFFWYFPGY